MTAARIFIAAGVAVGYVGGTVVGWTILAAYQLTHLARKRPTT